MDWYQPLFSVSVISERCTNNVISCDYSIINCLYDNHNYWENAHFHWNNQKPEGKYNNRSLLVVGTYLKYYRFISNFKYRSYQCITNLYMYIYIILSLCIIIWSCNQVRYLALPKCISKFFDESFTPSTE